MAWASSYKQRYCSQQESPACDAQLHASTVSHMDELLDTLRTGGVTLEVSIPANRTADVMAHLTTCHDHVFIVDQSAKAAGYVTLGVSGLGAACVAEALKA